MIHLSTMLPGALKFHSFSHRVRSKVQKIVYFSLKNAKKGGQYLLQKIREFGEKGGHFGAGIREKGGEIWILEHEYVPFLGPSGGAGAHGVLLAYLLEYLDITSLITPNAGKIKT